MRDYNTPTMEVDDQESLIEQEQGIFHIEGKFEDYYSLEDYLGEGTVGLVKVGV